MIGPRGNLALGVREPESVREQRFSADEDPEGAAAAPVILDDAKNFLRRGRGRLRRREWRLGTRCWGATGGEHPEQERNGQQAAGAGEAEGEAEGKGGRHAADKDIRGSEKRSAPPPGCSASCRFAALSQRDAGLETGGPFPVTARC